MITTISKTKVKCPRCKSSDLCITELWKGHSIKWVQVNGEIERKNGNIDPGDPYKIFCECSNCSHVWTVRGASQITDVIKEDI